MNITPIETKTYECGHREAAQPGALHLLCAACDNALIRWHPGRTEAERYAIWKADPREHSFTCQCTLHDNPVSRIEASIDSLQTRLPDLPSWAAHQIGGWDALARRLQTPRSMSIDSVTADLADREAESQYSHSDEAHR